MSRTFSKHGFILEKKNDEITKLMSAQDIYFSGSSLSNEIYTKREYMNGILGVSHSCHIIKYVISKLGHFSCQFE